MEAGIFEAKTQENHRYLESNEAPLKDLRTRTSLRLRYEAEVAVIRKKLGSLEEIRQSLGLSRRKICQLLMVDPSTWTRWTKDESRIPPHVYRALQWYLALIDKKAEWHPQNAFLGAFRSEPGVKGLQEEFKKELLRAGGVESRLKSELQEALRELELKTDRLQSVMTKENQMKEASRGIVFLNVLLLFGIIVYLILR